MRCEPRIAESDAISTIAPPPWSRIAAKSARP